MQINELLWADHESAAVRAAFLVSKLNVECNYWLQADPNMLFIAEHIIEEELQRIERAVRDALHQEG